MDPYHSSDNSKLNANQQQLNGDPIQTSQNASMVSRSVIVQQLPSTVQTTTEGSQKIQNTPANLNLIKGMAKVCLILGIITVIGTIFTAVGLISGLFLSSQGFAMVSSLLIGVAYSYIRQYGTIFCVITIAMILYDKLRYRISIKKLLIMAVSSLVMMNIPSIILFFLH